MGYKDNSANSSMLKTTPSPNTAQMITSCLPILPAYMKIRETTASSTIPVEPKIRETPKVSFTPLTTPLQNHSFKSQYKAPLFDRQTSAPKQLQQAATLRG